MLCWGEVKFEVSLESFAKDRVKSDPAVLTLVWSSFHHWRTITQTEHFWSFVWSNLIFFLFKTLVCLKKVLPLITLTRKISPVSGKNEVWGGQVIVGGVVFSHSEQQMIPHWDTVKAKALGSTLILFSTVYCSLVCCQEFKSRHFLTWNMQHLHCSRKLTVCAAVCKKSNLWWTSPTVQEGHISVGRYCLESGFSQHHAIFRAVVLKCFV